MLMGKGKADAIQKQMGTTRDPVLQRWGFSVPPILLAKGIPLLKAIGISPAMGALASVGDYAVDKIFGDGSGGKPTKSSRGISGRRARSTSIRASRKQSCTTHTSKKRVHKTGRTRAAGKIPKKTSRRGKAPARAAAGRRRRHERSKSGAPSSSFSSLWRRGKDIAHDQLETSGRCLFEKVKRKTKSKIKRKLAGKAEGAMAMMASRRGRQLTGNPFARNIRENLSRANAATTTTTTTPTSSNIGQMFNI